MAFHDRLFPPGVSYGSVGGPGFNTSIVETDSGAEERIGRWDNPKHRYDARFGVKTRAQMAELRRFYWARRGAAHSFRFKDWLDFTSNADGYTAGVFTDQQIGIGDGVTTTFQLTKSYTDGPITRLRNITKPVTGTIVVGKNGVNQSSGWTLDYSTGVLTFSVAPALTHAVTWGGEFNVHARFGKEIDSQFAASIEAFDTNSLPSIPIVEVIEDAQLEDEYFYGGAKFISSADNWTLAFNNGRVQVFNFSASGKSVTLPDNTDLPMGSPYLVIVNNGSNDFDLKKHDGTTIQTVAAGTIYTLSLGTDGSNPLWIVA